MKRFSLLLCLCCSMSLLLFAAPANQTIGGVKYAYSELTSTYRVSGYDPSSGLSSLTVLSKLTVEGKQYVVDAISDNAFKDQSALLSVVLPLTLKTIGESAFEGCVSLTSVRIPASVVEVGASAFKGCSALTAVTLDGRPSSFLGTGDTAPFSGVGSALSPAVLYVPAALYAAKVYKNGLNWSGYFLVAPIIPAAEQTLEGVVYTYKESITNKAFGVDLEQPCYVVTGFNAKAADAVADVVIPKVISGLPVLAIYSLSDPMIRSIEIDTLFSYNVLGTAYPLIMNIEKIEAIEDLPDNLAFAGLGTELAPVDVYVPWFDDAYNIMFNIAYQVGTAKGGYLNVYGREHKEAGVVYTFNRQEGYFAVSGFDAASAPKTVKGDDYTYQVAIPARAKGLIPIREVKRYAFNNTLATPNYNAQTAFIDHLTLPSGLQTIEPYAFSSLSLLDSIVVPASVKTIGNYAFTSMGSSKQGSQVITLIGTPASIGDNAFIGVGLPAKKGKLLCPKEDVDTYTKLLSPAFYGGYLDLVANTRKLTLVSADDKALTVIGAGDYSYLSEVEIEAKLMDEGFAFDGWSDGPKSLKRTIVLDKDSVLTASVSVKHFDVLTSVNNADMGSATGDGNYEYHQAVSLKATANEGYHFVNWNDDPALTSPTLDILVPFNGGTYKATFAPNNYTVSVSTNYPDKCTATGSGTYAYKQKVSLNTSGTDGYEFVDWSDGVKTAAREVEVPIGGLVLTANYRLLGQYTVTALADATMGYTTGSGSGFEHAVIHIEAVANAGYQFVKWSDDVTESARDITIDKSNVSLTALFEPIDYEVLGAVNDAKMGEVTGDLNYQPFNSLITLVATPKTGYHFVEWEDGSTLATRTLRVPLNGGTFTATFAVDMYELIAEPQDAQMGTVSGSGTYAYMSSATITAKANDGYKFLQWDDGYPSTSRTVVVMKDGTEYKALFEPLDYEILTAVNNNAMGSATGGSIYAFNTEVVLTATANAGFHFDHWSDGSTDNPHTILVPVGGGTYTAYFALNEYELSASITPANGGTVEGLGVYPYGTRVSLTAVANEGFTFSKWLDINFNQTKPTRSISVPNNDYAVQVEFVPNKYTITTSSNNQQWGTTTGDGSYDYLSKVEIEAKAKEGYLFVMWEDGSISQKRTITVPVNGASYAAIFAAVKYAITVASANPTMGSCQGSGEYDNGSKVEVEAVANDGYHFVEWSDGNKDAKRSITVSGNATLTATFAPDKYDIVANTNDVKMGSVTGGGSYDYLSEVQLTATPAEGYHFVSWEDDSTSPTRTITVPLNGSTYTATFAPNQYEIKLETNNADAGEVSGGGLYDYLTEVKISANAKEGYHFVEWSDGDKNAERTITVGLNGATYVATFAINTYTLTLSLNDETMGAVSGAGTYNHGAEAQIEAVANYGYHFVGWSDGEKEAKRTIIITSDTELTAQFDANEYTLTLLTDGDGTVLGGGTYKYLSKVKISAVGTERSHFTEWSDGVKEAEREIIIEGDSTLTASFVVMIEYHTLTLTVNDEQMGRTEGSGTYEHGQEVTIKAVPADGYRFEEWSDGVKEAERKVVVDKDIELMALFVVYDTALDDTERVATKARKVVVDGKVVIITPDGKKYSTAGQRVR